MLTFGNLCSAISTFYRFFAWSAQNAPGRPKGGNSTGARAVFEALPKFLNL